MKYSVQPITPVNIAMLNIDGNGLPDLRNITKTQIESNANNDAKPSITISEILISPYLLYKGIRVLDAAQ